MAQAGHKSFGRTNTYFTKDDLTLPPDDPRRRFFDRSNAFIPADNFQKDGALRSIHDFDGFDAFIKDYLQQDNFYRYADPLADVIVNMVGSPERTAQPYGRTLPIHWERAGRRADTFID